MMIYSPETHIGCRVLFLWESIALTGTVSSVGKDSYGIVCDSDNYTTDRIMIPRSNNEIFIKKSKCIKTGEISPIIFKNGILDTAQRFPDVRTAFYHLPKLTIYPQLTGGKISNLLKFEPKKHIFDFGDDRLYLYDALPNGVTSLIDINNLGIFKIPEWKYQDPKKQVYDKFDTIVNEDDVVKVYEIPDRFMNKPITAIVKNKMMYLVYNKKSNDEIHTIHNTRTSHDVCITHLPDTIVVNPNDFKKKGI